MRLFFMRKEGQSARPADNGLIGYLAIYGYRRKRHCDRLSESMLITSVYRRFVNRLPDIDNFAHLAVVWRARLRIVQIREICRQIRVPSVQPPNAWYTLDNFGSFCLSVFTTLKNCPIISLSRIVIYAEVRGHQHVNPLAPYFVYDEPVEIEKISPRRVYLCFGYGGAWQIVLKMLR